MLGDIYSEVYSAYQTYKVLRELGYDVHINWEIMRNAYYSADEPMSHLFDLSFADHAILYNQLNLIQQTCTLLPQRLNASFKIYLSEVHHKLKNYESLVYNPQGLITESNLYPLSDIPDDKQFLSQKVLDIGNKFLGDKKDKLKTVSLRVFDTDVHETFEELCVNARYELLIKDMFAFIEKNKDFNILVCTSVPQLAERVCDMYDNTFFNEFTHKHIRHVWPHGSDPAASEQDYVLHAQEIAAEMHCFAHSQEIFKRTGSANHTAFLTYGLVHNVHHVTWQDRLSKLFV